MTGAAEAAASWYAVHGPNGDLTWRVQSPAAAVGAKVTLIPDTTGADDLYWPNLDSVFPWVMEVRFEDGTEDRVASKEHWQALCEQRARLTDRRIVHLNHEGSSAVFTRPLAFGAAHMMDMRKQGVRVLAECDDNYLSAASLNVFMRMAGWAENDRNAHIRSIAVGDGLILSTDYLRDIYWKGLRAEFGKKNLPELFVCRNHIDEQYIPDVLSPPRDDGKLRIGYMGSDSHVWDVDLVFDALYDAWLDGHEIVFVGINPRNLNPKYRQSKKDWSKLGYTHVPWRIDGFRGSALPLDIGLAPLVVNNHTLGKSDIKIMEYALSGAPTIAQNCLVYNRTFKHGETALLAGSPAEYLTQLRALTSSADLRQRLVDNTMQYIREERLLSNNTAEWREAIYG